MNYNNLKQAVLSELCFYANTLPLKHYENPVQDFFNINCWKMFSSNSTSGAVETKDACLSAASNSFSIVKISSRIFKLNIHQLNQVKNDLNLKIFSFLYFFGTQASFRHLYRCSFYFFYFIFFLFKRVSSICQCIIRPEEVAQSVQYCFRFKGLAKFVHVSFIL